MINDSYRWPFIFSVLFHAVLLALLLFSLHDYLNYTASQQSGTSQNNPVIQAVAINQQQVENQKIQIKTQQKKIDLKQIKQQQEQAKTQQLLTQQKQLEAQKTEAQQAPKPVEKPIEKSVEHPIAEPTKTVTSLLEKKIDKPVVEKKRIDPKLKQSMERELQKQLAQESAEQEVASKAASKAKSEAKEATSQASAAHVQGEVDKYKALIVQAISQHWVIPDGVRQDLSCELLIRVAADGDVLSVEIARSSGDAVLDRSARAAVFKAAPLPVPKEAEVFDRFRELRLTVRPENIL